MQVIELKNLCVSIKSQSGALKDLVSNASFSLNSGEVLAIIGPNGAGKSSLLKAIDGQLTHSGTLSMPDIAQHPQARAKQLAILPQQSVLNFPFTVSEVVELGRIPHATGKQADIEIVQEALKLMDLTHLSHRIYTELSGGEQQRTQLARVFCQIWHAPEGDAPRLLLLDEPTTSLDLGHQHFLMQSIQAFAARGVAVIMVLHNINLAARYAGRLLAMLDSQTIAYGTPDEVVNQSNMEQLFGLPVEILRSAQSGSPVVVGV